MDKENFTQKWLEGRISPQELERFRNTEEYRANMEVLKYAKMFKAPEYTPVESLNELISSRQQPVANTGSLWLNRLLRIASVLLIGFAIYYFYPHKNTVSVNTGIGEKASLELPDASMVTINAGSEVSYNKSTWEDEKQISLTGEAYFDVARGGQFKVVTGDWTVSVVGTKFNVKQRQQYFEVQCFEGVVKVASGEFEKELRAGNNLKAFNGRISFGTNVYQQPQWTSNISAIQNTQLREVIAELERQFGISIQASEIDKNRLFTGGFVHDNLEDALTAITEPLNLKYTIDSKRQVTITPR